MTRKRSSSWLKLLAFSGATLVALLFAEIILRCCWHNPYATEEPDRIVTLRMQHANADHRIDRSAIDASEPVVSFRVDDRSYVRPSFQYTDPDYTVAFLGGSTTECCAVTESLRFPALVSSELAQRGLRVTTLNAGTSGNTVHDSLNILLNHVSQDDPDFAVLMHACNDIGLLSREGAYRARAGVAVSWANVARSAAMKLTNYSYVMAIVRQVVREHTHFVPTDPDALEARPAIEPSEQIDGEFRKRLHAFVALARSFQIEPVLMTQPISSHFTKLTPAWVNQDMQARFNEIVRMVGKAEGVLVIDLVDHLQSQVPDWDRHMHVFYDGIHVTDQGSQIYGQFIARVLADELNRYEEPRPIAGVAARETEGLAR